MNRDNAILTILPAGKVRVAFEMRTTTSKRLRSHSKGS